MLFAFPVWVPAFVEVTLPLWLIPIIYTAGSLAARLACRVGR